MFSTITSTAILLASAIVVTAAPHTLQSRDIADFPVPSSSSGGAMRFCTDSHGTGVCTTRTFPFGTCRNIDSELNDGLSSAITAPGVVCTLYKDIDCPSTVGGLKIFSNGNENFENNSELNDVVSSVVCNRT